jgi:hypothetical protein
MGSADTGAAILDAVAQVKAANPRAKYCCDPVIGDVGRGVFVRPGIPEFMRGQAVRAADIVTPNQFELDLLSGRGSATRREALAAIDAVHALGPKAILVTSLHTDETPSDAIDLVASDASGRVRVRTPKLPISINGAGDAIAALFFAHYLRTGRRRGAVARRIVDLRAAQAHRRRGFARNPADRRAGRIRQSEPRVRGRDESEEAIMRRRFVTLDVFTDKRFAGNPLAVVLDPRARHRRDAEASRASSICPKPCSCFRRRQGEPRASCASSRRRASFRSPAIRRSARRCCSAHRRRRRAHFTAGRADRPRAMRSQFIGTGQRQRVVRYPPPSRQGGRLARCRADGGRPRPLGR